MIVSARVSRRDHSTYVLRVRATPVGWLRTGAIGFCGFGDADDARRAALTAASVLDQWFRARWKSAAPLAWNAAAAVEDEVATGGTVVGRVVSPCRIPDQDGESHGFELRVPDELWVATGVELAQRIWVALGEAGRAPAQGADLLPAS